MDDPYARNDPFFGTQPRKFFEKHPHLLQKAVRKRMSGAFVPQPPNQSWLLDNPSSGDVPTPTEFLKRARNMAMESFESGAEKHIVRGRGLDKGKMLANGDESDDGGETQTLFVGRSKRQNVMSKYDGNVRPVSTKRAAKQLLRNQDPEILEAMYKQMTKMRASSSSKGKSKASSSSSSKTKVKAKGKSKKK